jgi:hypothetical protein
MSDVARRASKWVLIAASALLALEMAPRLPWVVLPYDLGAELFGCYRLDDPERSIFFAREELGMRLMKPNFEGTCYSVRRWHHATDAYGQRNPETWERVEVALLGGGVVYGEGVNEQETAAHRLRELLGQRVANLGHPWASPAEDLILLRNFGLPLRPRTVVLAISANDLAALEARDPQRMLRFLEVREGPESVGLPREQLLSPDERESRPLLERLFARCLTCRTLQFYRARGALRDLSSGVSELWERTARAEPQASPASASSAPLAAGPLPPPALPATPSGETAPSHRPELAKDYLVASVRVMAELSKSSGARFVLVYLPPPPDDSRRIEDSLLPLLRLVASELHIEFLDASPVLRAPDAHGRQDYDPFEEGLFGPRGQEKLAEALGRLLRNPGAFERAR